MAAVTTKKPGGSMAVQLTFPEVATELRATTGNTYGMLPSVGIPEARAFVGGDFFAALQLQRKADADAMANAKVQSTKSSERRYLTNPHGANALPAPVLSQRVFANPSLGLYTPYSARNDGSVSAPFSLSSPFVGGVLRSAEGQAYGKSKLMDRINQLNAIQSAKNEMLTGMPSTTARPSPDMAARPTAAEGPLVGNLTELNLLLSQIETEILAPSVEYTAAEREAAQSFREGVRAAVRGAPQAEAAARMAASRLRGVQAVNDRPELNLGSNINRFTQLLFRTAPEMNEDELSYLYSRIQNINTLLESALDPDANLEETNQRTYNVFTTISNIMRSTEDYLQKMVEARETNKDPRALARISSALVKQFQFNKSMNDVSREIAMNPGQAVETAAKDNQRKEEIARRYGVIAQRQREGLNAVMEYEDGFDRGAGNAEDDEFAAEQPLMAAEVAAGRRPFNPDVRQRFGNQSGQFFERNGGRAFGFFGEAQAEDMAEAERRMGLPEGFIEPMGAAEAGPQVQPLLERREFGVPDVRVDRGRPLRMEDVEAMPEAERQARARAIEQRQAQRARMEEANRRIGIPGFIEPMGQGRPRKVRGKGKPKADPRVKMAMKLRGKGKSLREIGKDMGVSHTTISKLLKKGV